MTNKDECAIKCFVVVIFSCSVDEGRMISLSVQRYAKTRLFSDACISEGNRLNNTTMIKLLLYFQMIFIKTLILVVKMNTKAKSAILTI